MKKQNRPQRTWTIGDILKWTEGFLKERGVDTPRLDGELLLSHTLKVDRIHLYTNHDRPLTSQERAALRKQIVERANGKPVAYLTGKKEFWTREYQVDSRVLVPRPETEFLVEEGIKILKNLQPHHQELVAADVGTGSGCIAISMAEEVPQVKVLAIDISAPALEVAAINVEAAGLEERITLSKDDLLASVPEQSLDLIVSNPPYIPDLQNKTHPKTGPQASTPETELAAAHQWVLRHEPPISLLAGPDGLQVYKRLLPQAFEKLKNDRHCLVEIGMGQKDEVVRIGEGTGFTLEETVQDLAGIPRVIIFKKP